MPEHLLAKAEWGTVPDWVTAFGTLAAFAVALRLLAKELSARHDQEEDRRREQAGLVSVWPDLEIQHDEASQVTNMTFLVHIRNGGQEPVHVRVTLVAE
jgi:hypothetical protein